jgi:thiamine-monophosphate kinase
MSNLTSENSIIQLLQKRYPGRGAFVKKGIGDDGAVVCPGPADEYWVITTDTLLEGIDFRREWTTPYRLGYKSIAVNLSDLAAMGARPRWFTVSLALPPGISKRWILEFYRGLNASNSSKGSQLIGGDLSLSESGILISVTAVGESLNHRVLYRSGGRAGDLLYVTGVLGRSAAGLKLLQSGGGKSRSHPKQEALQAHQTPKPRCQTGIWLAQSGLVRCMMDLSDGLSVDLPRLCKAGGVGAEIHLADLPIFPESRAWGCDPVKLALHGGEDYELLFAVPKSKSRLLEQSYPSKFPSLTQIGRFTGTVGRIWTLESGKRHLLPQQGYDHFRRNP